MIDKTKRCIMKKIAILMLAVILCALLPVGAFADSDHVVINDILADAVQFTNGNYYKLFTEKCSWEQAKVVCEGMGGHLATITSKDEDEFCFNMFLRSGEKGGWIGATDADSEGNWKWVTGEPFNYNSFPDSEPNGGTNSNAVQYSRTYTTFANGVWDDYIATEKLAFICEWEQDNISYVRSNYAIVNESSKAIFKDAIIFNGHIYKLFCEPRSWEDAKAYCESLGGHLATVTSAAEDFMLFSFLARSGGKDCYLGATDAQTEGVWKWVTGERWDYANWSYAEPNGGAKQNWLAYYAGYETGKWDDGSGNLWFWCEWEYACIRADGGIGEHAFGEIESLTQASCKEYGFGVHTCNECGYTEWIQTEKTEHNFGEWEDVVKASCTLDGEMQRTCDICGKTESQTVPAISHNFGEWRHVKGNKFLPPIVNERLCSHCGEIESQEDMSSWWLTPVIVAGVIVSIIGVVGYIKAYK